MGCGSPLVRLPGSLPCGSCSFQCPHSPSELFPIIHQGIGSECCGCRSQCERSARTFSSFSRLLQLPVYYPQSRQGLAACNRSLTPQPFCSGLSFSHGDSIDSSPVFLSGGLVGVSQSSRRLPSGTSASGISSLPEVLRGGRSVSVSRSLLRPFNCSADIHSCHGPDLVDHASFRLQDPEVHRQLASPRLLVPRDCTGEGLSPLAVSGAWHSSQPGQELPDSFTDAGLSGDEALDVSFEGLPNPQTCPEALLSRLRIHLLSSAASVSVASAVGGNVVAVDYCSGVQASDEIPSALAELCRPSPSGL